MASKDEFLSPIFGEEITLKRFKATINFIISKTEWERWDYKVKLDMLGHLIQGQINAFMFGKKHSGVLEIQTPKTWKDMFKLKHQKKWWMKRWIKKHPIKYTKQLWDIDRYTTFPEYIVPRFLQDQKHLVYYNSKRRPILPTEEKEK